MNTLDQYKVNVPEGRSGSWSVERCTVTEEQEAIQRLRCAFNPQRPARWVPAGTYTRLVRNGDVIMSDTPDEIRDHLPAVRAATGHCLVGGLGLGMVAKAMLDKPEVTKVTVIELDADVCKLVGEPMKAQYGDRLELVQADALAWKPSNGQRYGAVWMDIWDAISQDNLPEMAKLKRRFSRRAEWIGCWQQEGCKAQRDRIRSGRGWY